MKYDPHFEVYPDSAGEWHWRLISSNGNIIASSTEEYHNKRDCIAGLKITNPKAPFNIYGEEKNR